VASIEELTHITLRRDDILALILDYLVIEKKRRIRAEKKAKAKFEAAGCEPEFWKNAQSRLSPHPYFFLPGDRLAERMFDVIDAAAFLYKELLKAQQKCPSDLSFRLAVNSLVGVFKDELQIGPKKNEQPRTIFG
jgi:hypothetical protein